MMKEEITRDIEVRPSSVALWFGALAGPIAWLIDLQIKYALVQYVCRNRAEWIFWVTALGALILAVAGIVVAFPHVASDDRRIRFMALAGIGISAMFSLAIIAMSIPDIFLKACD
jgi:hypothetical protein